MILHWWKWNVNLLVLNMCAVDPGQTDVLFIPSAHLCLRRCLYSRHLLVQWQNIRHRAHRRDGEWVDLAVTLGVVLLDVSEFSRAAEGLVVPVKIAQPPGRQSQYDYIVVSLRIILLVEVGVAAADVPDVALEVLHVNGIEADDCGEEADVLLCEAVAEVERTAGLDEVCLRTIQGLEKLDDSLFICLLGTAGMSVENLGVMA